jgi:hypothetical protein
MRQKPQPPLAVLAVGKGFHSLAVAGVVVLEEVVIEAGELWKHVEVRGDEVEEMSQGQGCHSLSVASLLFIQ